MKQLVVMENRIRAGDYVNVFFEYCDAIHKAKVISTPSQPMECYVLKAQGILSPGVLIYVMHFSKMIRVTHLIKKDEEIS
jgi:hypothetical protein